MQDYQTSPCINAGDPASPCGNEPAETTARIDMGYYGNTAEASKSSTATSVVFVKAGATGANNGTTWTDAWTD